jgi:uncharacterized protein YbbC (DUF1343 family)
MTGHQTVWKVGRWALGVVMATTAYAQRARGPEPERPRFGVDVLLEARIATISGRRLGLVIGDGAVDRHGDSVEEVLATGTKARKARATVVLVHRMDVADPKPPTDAALRGVETLIVDLPDVGTRPSSSLTLLRATLVAAARLRIPIVVLDRPNPLNGLQTDGAIADSATADPAVGLYPLPTRHGMTLGELAALFNDREQLNAPLTVIPAKGWRRSMWPDETDLPWRAPRADLDRAPTVILAAALAPFEATALSIGRGTSDVYRVVGAPGLPAKAIADLLNDRLMAGVKFSTDRFTPSRPADGKFDGVAVDGVRITVTNRGAMNPLRVAAALVWAIGKLAPERLLARTEAFDRAIGARRVRVSLLAGEDPDSVMDRELAAAVAFRDGVRSYLLYR